MEEDGMSVTERAGWRSPALGEAHELELPDGRLRCFEAGEGAPIVFVHGLLVNANLWRKVVAPLSREFRCIALDLPLGSHLAPAGERADLSPPGLAEMIANALEALGLDDATLVGNDTGGALAQILVTTRPERVGRLVLTSCDFGDNFPPPAFRPLKVVARVPGATEAVLTALRPRAPRRLPLAYGWLAKRPIERAAEDSYVLPALADAGVRGDLRRALVALDPRHTRTAAARLPGFDRPALVAWSRGDRFFPTRHAEELARLLPDARLEWIDDSYTFSPEDRPDRVAELVAAFAREPARATGAEPDASRARAGRS
jgi:pimeloyl-ACP methyl ester carboxylesterase